MRLNVCRPALSFLFLFSSKKLLPLAPQPGGSPAPGLAPAAATPSTARRGCWGAGSPDPAPAPPAGACARVRVCRRASQPLPLCALAWAAAQRRHAPSTTNHSMHAALPLAPRHPRLSPGTADVLAPQPHTHNSPFEGSQTGGRLPSECPPPPPPARPTATRRTRPGPPRRPPAASLPRRPCPAERPCATRVGGGWLAGRRPVVQQPLPPREAAGARGPGSARAGRSPAARGTRGAGRVGALAGCQSC